MPLLKVPAAAKAIGLPYDTLWRACRARAIPTIRLTPRSSYLVDLDDIKAWLEQHRVDAVDGRAAAVRRPRVPRPALEPEPVSATSVFNPVEAFMPPADERRFS